MIAELIGELHQISPPFIIINVSGVCYEVEISLNTLSRFSQIGHKCSILTQQIIREDAHLLYGFAEHTERELFRALIKVNGVGPKLAMSILSHITPEQFSQSVNQQDTQRLVALPGIGKKTAERLVVEMRDRLSAALPVTEHQEAASALIALGYKPQEANKMLTNIDTQDKTPEAIIKAALKASMKGQLA